jgi:NTP pyrophosphatase (non-canonical NTP hydrolase)
LCAQTAPRLGEPFFVGTWIIMMDAKNLTIKDLTKKMHELVKSKGWYEKDSKRPQTPRNLAVSLSIEAAEILEHFQFGDEIKNKDDLGSELADVTLYLLQLASVSGIDLEEVVLKKIEVNKTREWDVEE